VWGCTGHGARCTVHGSRYTGHGALAHRARARTRRVDASGVVGRFWHPSRVRSCLSGNRGSHPVVGLAAMNGDATHGYVLPSRWDGSGGARGTGYGARCAGHGSRGTVHGARYTVHGSRCAGHGARGTVHGSRFTVHGARGTGHGARGSRGWAYGAHWPHRAHGAHWSHGWCVGRGVAGGTVSCTTDL
jgi:hypothetical protein